MKTFRKQILLFLLSLTSILLATQIQQTSFEQITTADGLSQNDINDIYQDSRGLMWFGNNEGLNKYDGYSFTVYKPVPNGAGTYHRQFVLI